MNKIFNNRTVLMLGFLPTISTKEITFEQYRAARGLYIIDPWERVKSIFSTDALGNRHPEFIHALQMTKLGALVGLFFGGVTESIQKTENFIDRNDTNIFINKREGYKVVINHNMLSFIKGGLKSAPAFAIFFGGFFLISSCCEAYRNKPAIVDSVVAGTAVGSLSRFMFGIKGMISGGIVGSVLGTIYGCTLWCATKLTKTDQIELKYAQFAISKYKKEYIDTPTTDEKSLRDLYNKLSSQSNESTLLKLDKEDESRKSKEEN